MVRGGWAKSDTYKPDDMYKEQLDAAEQFSVNKVLDVRLFCGRFGQEPGSTPSREQVRQARQSQPNQGQFAQWEPTPDPAPTAVPLPQQQPPQQQPAPSGNCDPSYSTICIPPRSQVRDLDCGDIGYRRFQVNSLIHTTSTGTSTALDVKAGSPREFRQKGPSPFR
jgi:hypothetical protein